ncbi:TetR/AcrR family transcriptional regulator [Desulfotignum balticum]|uniref:TetR family transcriptional regulator n=1 Tax=Desulfotignum balticum TaxID=115781 RepID=C4B7T1_9BACT|nr:TetR/AcrR family transcriptional regulator [Desulfotignum balticum]BAH60913.1 TetR family transcriptional regulator [Desulfotignum balticum]
MGYRKKTEQKIIQAAIELFVRKGYHGTSISDITSRIGLTKGALYAHFKSKGDLLIRIIHEYEIQFIDQLILTVDAIEGDEVEKLNGVITFSSRFALENYELCVFLTVLTSELNANIDFQPILKATYRKLQQYISEIIRKGILKRVIDKQVDPDLAALTFMAIQDGILHQWTLNRDYIDGRQFVKTFRHLFIKGMLP